MCFTLQPCPFCGSSAELRERWGDCARKPYYEVECTNLDCGPCQDTEQEAVEYWNKRAVNERQRMLVEAATFCKCAIDNYIHKEWGIQELQESYDRLKAALAVKEGEWKTSLKR